MKETTRCQTGIKGFDALIGGGFPKGKAILISGTPGCGKTLFALQFLYNGALLHGESGMYVSFEEETLNLLEQARQLGMDFEPLIKKNKVSFVSIPASSIEANTSKDILRIVKKKGCGRLVIDSLSTLSINTPTTFVSEKDLTEISIQRFIYHFISEIRKVGATSILISQAHKGQLSREGISEFICDGIVQISQESLGGQYSRSLIIPKMRETKNDEDVHPLEIGSKGIIVHTMR